jgi:glycosyltransferase involved in cell wall biosynthesis
MNIGLDAKRIFFNTSGLGNYGRRFYDALAKKSPGDNFYLYTPRAVHEDNPYLKDIISDKSRIFYPRKTLHKLFNGTFWRSALMNKQLEKDNIDIYYGLSNEIPFGIKKLKLVKVVVIHDLIFLRFPELYPFVDVLFYKKKTKYSCINADYIIAASQQTKLDIINYYHVPGDKITVIYPGSDPMFYSNKIADTGEYFRTAKRYIISIGAITPRKNLFKTVQAFNLVKDKYDLDLVVIGTAVGLGREYLKKVREYLVKNGLEGRVHFLGNVPYKYLPGLCRNAQLMVYPSQFEGFGMPIVEGLFSKIPVITSKGGCFPEAGGDGAVYVDPDDYAEIAAWIGIIMDSPTVRDELVQKGLRYSEKFRQENIEADVLKFHKELKANIKRQPFNPL